ncbi:SDR family NAD(P)-dependent oxidoreductase [Chryseobacterium sp. Bi04]|uniref:SDR family NAD(P)-dependent oxidoreductase n=1 Tax=Chryseobacterium sp. Bi04 TaxID=2822345 RepID=UPI001DB032FB|nr:SDR family NAD(P)-dependent oxidoreductase [Chryseobacterium sp. Bi04]CAH0273042.1 putative oxidoreductase Rv1350 [Chryseobacterium sp. Bi04]
MIAQSKIWFITGTSKGFGWHLTKLLLSKGDKVIATSRTPENLEKDFPDNDNLLALKVDITSDTDVKNAVEKSIQHFGRIDAVVNNAGYVLIGSIEELTDQEFRDTVNVNLFGTLNVLRAVLPHLRKQKSGNIINIASNAGYVGMSNVAAYNASKFAIIGISEALRLETKDFGIKVTVIAPGQFRTNLWESGAIKFPSSPIKEYSTEKFEDFFKNETGKQVGDPYKLVKIITEIADLEDPPSHLLLGKDTYDMVIEHRINEKKEFDKWKEVSLSTNFD